MRKKSLLLTVVVALSLSACFGGGDDNNPTTTPTTGTVSITSSSEASALPSEGILVVSVYVDGSATAAASKTIDTVTASVTLTVTSSAGTHSYVVKFEYTDQVYGGPFQIAVSNPKNDDVVAGHAHNISFTNADYSYQDLDSDGFSNLAELAISMRTDPGDPQCVLEKSILEVCTLG